MMVKNRESFWFGFHLENIYNGLRPELVKRNINTSLLKR